MKINVRVPLPNAEPVPHRSAIDHSCAIGFLVASHFKEVETEIALCDDRPTDAYGGTRHFCPCEHAY